MPVMKVEKSVTERGFELRKFTDLYGTKCSLQASSLATDSAIWLGVADPDPKVMASDAAAVGVRTEQTTGWVPYPIPEQVMLKTRMHLNQSQVRRLLPILQHFADTGELP